MNYIECTQFQQGLILFSSLRKRNKDVSGNVAYEEMSNWPTELESLFLLSFSQH